MLLSVSLRTAQQVASYRELVTCLSTLLIIEFPLANWHRNLLVYPKGQEFICLIQWQVQSLVRVLRFKKQTLYVFHKNCVYLSFKNYFKSLIKIYLNFLNGYFINKQAISDLNPTLIDIKICCFFLYKNFLFIY